MSRTYRRLRMQSSFDRLAESSSGLMDYRSRLCYIAIAKKHPKWNKAVIKGLAETKGMFITLFQRPLEFFMGIKMKVKLLLNKHKVKNNGKEE